MATMIQIRHVPEDTHRTLKARAALAGMSLSEYLLREITRTAEKPTLEELKERMRHRHSVYPDIDPVDAVREERERT